MAEQQGSDFSKSRNAAFRLDGLSWDHWILLLINRKWLVAGTFLLVSAGTAIYTFKLPNVYYSETLVLVNPQQIPERYVTPTVSSDIRSRLTTLSQQILSSTRLQTIIDRFNLYAEQRRLLPHEMVVDMMRKDIVVNTVSDMQAFKIGYSGEDPRMVAQVANELASLFIQENLKARERVAIGTSDFIQTELENTRAKLEEQESKLRDFKMNHLGELPDQQVANLQIMGQLQIQLEGVTSALERAEQQRSYLQTLLQTQTVEDPEKAGDPVEPAAPAPQGPSEEEIQLAALLARYGENHPDVLAFKRAVEERQRARQKAETAQAKSLAAVNAPASAPVVDVVPPATLITQKQLAESEKEIAQRKEERQRLTDQIAEYRARVESIPIREQQIAGLVRDYGIATEYYSQLVSKRLSAETGTELESRQKGEQFTILDPAQVPESPSRPNRPALYAAGGVAGFGLGLALALLTEILGITITSPQQIESMSGIAMLGVIPVLRTGADRRRKHLWEATTAVGVIALIVIGAFLLYHYQGRVF